MRKYKFKKGDRCIMIKDCMYVKKGTIVKILENSHIPYTNNDIGLGEKFGDPINQDNAELLSFKHYLKLL